MAVVGGDTRVVAADARGGASSPGSPARASSCTASASCRRRPSPSSRPAAACLGAMISASHNPYPDNGIKLFAPGGAKLDRRRRGAHRGRSSTRTCPRADRSTRRRCVDVEAQPGLRRARRSAPSGGRRLDGLRVVVDSANGAASALRRPLLARDRRRRHRRSTTSPTARNINAACGATDTGVAGRRRRRERRRPRSGARRRRRPADRRRPHRRARRRRPHHRHLRHRPAAPRRCCATTPSS